VTGLAGTGPLIRLALRRDRFMMLAWIYVTSAGVAGVAYWLGQLYPTAAKRDLLASAAGTNPALVFLYGKLYGDSTGALTAWRYGVWGAIFAALMSVFVVIGSTRADEEAGRLELIGSTAVGRHAPLTAALAVTAIGNVLLGVLVTAGLILTGQPAAGSAALALAIAAAGVAFGCVGGLAAQVASGARAARGIALGALGAAYLLRAVADTGSAAPLTWLSWLSPLGWTEQVQPFAGQRWWALALPAGVAAGLGGAAYAVAARRDHGAGLLPGRPGRAGASALLSGVFGLAWRLDGSTLAGWVAGFAFLGAVLGAAAKGIGSLLGSSSVLQNEFTRIGGQTAITNAYLAAIMGLAGLIAAAYATSAALRLRVAETTGAAEAVLASTVSRLRWALSHVTVLATGTAALLTSAGLAIGLGYGLRTDDLGEVPRLLGAALAQLPAALAIAGLTVLLFGAAPRVCVGGGWAAVVAALVIELFGTLLRFPRWMIDISPFTHMPKLPGGPVHAAPLIWVSLAAVALTATGLTALRQRDIG